MSAWAAALDRLAQSTPRELNDNIVRPGWIGFGVFLALVVASFFLFRSMNRQLKKVDFEEKPADPPGARDPSGDDGTSPAGDEPPPT